MIVLLILVMLSLLKEEMRAPVKKVTRIFVARIPQSVTEAMFRRYLSVNVFIEIIQTYETQTPT